MLHLVTHSSENVPVSTLPPPSHKKSYDSSTESTVGLLSIVSESLVTVREEEPYSWPKSVVPHLLNQEDLNDLIRDLELIKDKLELLALILMQGNIMLKEVKCTYFRTCQ